MEYFQSWRSCTKIFGGVDEELTIRSPPTNYVITGASEMSCMNGNLTLFYSRPRTSPSCTSADGTDKIVERRIEPTALRGRSISLGPSILLGLHVRDRRLTFLNIKSPQNKRSGASVLPSIVSNLPSHLRKYQEEWAMLSCHLLESKPPLLRASWNNPISDLLWSWKYSNLLELLPWTFDDHLCMWCHEIGSSSRWKRLINMYPLQYFKRLITMRVSGFKITELCYLNSSYGYISREPGSRTKGIVAACIKPEPNCFPFSNFHAAVLGSRLFLWVDVLLTVTIAEGSFQCNADNRFVKRLRAHCSRLTDNNSNLQQFSLLGTQT